MTYDEKSAWAGEYVLGTLPDEERRAFERALATDAELAALVTEWEERLSGLTDAIDPVVPPPSAWEGIAAEIAETAAIEPTAAADSPGLVIELRRRIATWRTATIATGALAAALAGVVILGPTINPVPTGEQYVAVVSRGGDLPALLVNVDTETGTIAVRSVAAEAPAGRSQELWYVVEGRDPLSLGLVDRIGDEIVVSIDQVQDFEPTNALFAISDEPLGGSPTGAPTGEIIYTGTLIPAPHPN